MLCEIAGVASGFRPGVGCYSELNQGTAHFPPLAGEAALVAPATPLGLFAPDDT